MVCPVAPHVCEELWPNIGGKGFIVNAKWPTSDQRLINAAAENSEGLLRKTLTDVDAVKKIVAKKGLTAKGATLFVALTKMFPDAKQKALQLRVLQDAKDFLSRELELKIEIVDADASKHEKAFKARPDKLGILIE